MTPPDDSADDSVVAAVATPPGRGGIGIVRISGGDLGKIIAGILPRPPAPRTAVFTPFLDADGGEMDRGIALYFPAPHSFTGQEVLELQGHGGGGVLRRILSRCMDLGARAAQPGEFTLRAYLNGKMDLAQADAVADIVNAESDAAAKAAARSLTGVFSREIESASDSLEAARTGVEAAMDFADEELGENDFASAALEQALDKLRRLLARAGQGVILTEGISAAIAGPPNAGKSSLLNRLSGEDAAIVSPAPGTTRDAVLRDIALDGLRIHLADTAGLRDEAEEIEREGICRAKRIAAEADLILLVSDDSRATDAAALDFDPGGEVIPVRNKIDLDGEAPGIREGTVFVSAKSGAGMDALRGEILRVAGFCESEPPFSARERHLRALDSALGFAQQARRDWTHPELAAEGLRRARDALASITGDFGDEELLGEIFSRFCVGK